MNDLKKIDMDSLRENEKEFIQNNKLTVKSYQKLINKKHNVFTEKVNKTNLSANGGKEIQSVDSTKRFPYGTNEQIIHKK